MLIIEYINKKNSKQIEASTMWIACIDCHRILQNHFCTLQHEHFYIYLSHAHVCQGQTDRLTLLIISIQMYIF